VSLAPGAATGGVTITMLGSGSATIQATAAGATLCGTASLTIEAATTEQWQMGEALYNSGVILSPASGQTPGPDGGFTQTACATCHSPSATSGPFINIAATPEQVAGLADADLIATFTQGTVPSGYFDPSLVSASEFQHFHFWSLSADEAQAVVVYLRSLKPGPQNGSSTFGGFGSDGGSHHHLPDGG
jgi:mono/diheme cytochrome c family protein